MKDKFETIKQLNTKLVKSRGRLKWPIVLLVLQGLIWWICNPGFVPFLTDTVIAVQEFLLELLLPQSAADTESYRYYIGALCDWVAGLPFYPVLAKLVPWIVPAWLLLTVIQILILRWRINFLRRPSKEPKKPASRKKKASSEKPAAMPLSQALRPKATDSGLFVKSRIDAELRFQELQNRCSIRRYKDRGIWLSNFRPVDGEVPFDRILHWDKDGIAVLADAYTFQFALIDGTAHIIGNRGKIPMKKGVPYTLKHMNDAGEPIVYCRATWLGGI